MKLSARSAAWLLPLLLTGCIHKTQVAQNQPLAPPIEDTPPPKPEPAPTNLPPPEVTIPVQPEPQVHCSCRNPVKKPAKHKKPANTKPQVASNATPAVPAIGQLTTADPPNMRQQTDASIAVDGEKPEWHHSQAGRPGSRRRLRRFGSILKQARGCADVGRHVMARIRWRSKRRCCWTNCILSAVRFPSLSLR